MKTRFPFGKCSAASFVPMATQETKRERSRFVTPGMTFCSWISVGIPIRLDAKRIGPQTYPPVPTATSGLKRRTMPMAFTTPPKARAPRTRFSGVRLRLKPWILTVSKAIPSFGTISASKPSFVPTYRNSASGIFFWMARTMVSAG